MLAAYLRGGLARLRPPLPTAGLASSALPGIELLDSLWDKETPLGESSAYRRHRHEQGYSQKKKIKQRHRNVRRADRATAAMATATCKAAMAAIAKLCRPSNSGPSDVGVGLGRCFVLRHTANGLTRPMLLLVSAAAAAQQCRPNC